MFLEFLKIISYLILIIILAEVVLYVFPKFKSLLFFKEKSRKHFLDPEYHNYLKRFESKTPLFKYLPIGIRFFNDDEKIIGVRNNSLGFRCREFKDKEENVIRVVLLGGSVAYGCGATNNDNTISGNLEKILNEKNKNGSKIECYNLSQINNFLSQDLLIANTFFYKLKPDFVVSFAGWNEIAASYLQNQEKLKKFRTYLMEEVGDLGPLNLPSYRKELFLNIIKKYFKDNSRILSFIKKKDEYGPRLGSDKNLFEEKKFHDQINLSSNIFLEHVNKFYLMSKGYNFEYIQFLQPHIYKKKNLTENEKKVVELYNHVRPAYGGMEFSDFLMNNSIYNQIHDGLKRSGNVECYNLENMFKDTNENIFFTLVHTNDKGYELMAKKISDVLVNKINNFASKAPK